MKKYSNKEKISLPMAVWLAEDTYDHKPDPMHISATGILKSVKQIILAKRVPVASASTPTEEIALEDISANTASAMGTALHDSLENAWKNSYRTSMEDLGYPDSVINRIKINPEPEDLKEDTIAVYLEQRVEKKLGPYTISGKYDMILDGRLQDYKSTGVYSYIKGNNDKKYSLQGSIYRWLNPDKITDDQMDIQFIFTDWSKLRANIEASKGYPQSRVLAHPVDLMSVEDTIDWLKEKLTLIHKHTDGKEEDMPACTIEELWRDPDIYKYFAKATNKRATKNFENYYEAQEYLVSKGSIGEVRTVHGQVRACKWCDAFAVCVQKNTYLNDGTLVID